MGVPFSKADVVKYHGMAGISMGAMFLLESSGINIPLVGAAAVIPGFEDGGVALIYVTRFLASIFIGLGLYESNYYNNPTTQKIYDLYHYLASASLIISTKAAGGTGMHWLYAGVVTAFTVAGVAAK